MSKKATVMSGLALLAAGISLALTIQEKKRSQKRNAAVCDYIENQCAAVTREAADYTRKETTKVKQTAEKMFSEAMAGIRNLENGVIPDYEEAKKAADAVNDFHRGISNIMGFDPVAALRKDQRVNETGKEGV